MSPYPVVYNEEQTLGYALGGMSLARFGDGELRIVNCGRAKSQCYVPGLAKELAKLLHKRRDDVLTCIPNLISATPKMWFWHKYLEPKYVKHYTAGPYGSTWITRADDAPWIDTPQYWLEISKLWTGKDITLVRGDDRSLTPTLLAGAGNIREVMGPSTDAYASVDRIEEEIGVPSGPVILCLGATATVLASRLARKGVHALDLGHLGMFMKRRNKREAANAAS